MTLGSVSVNVKLQNFVHESKIGKYTICTMFMIDHLEMNFSEVKSDSPKAEKIMDQLQECNF